MEEFPDLFDFSANYDGKDFEYLGSTVFDLTVLTPPLSPEVNRVTQDQSLDIGDYEPLLKSEWDQTLASDDFKSEIDDDLLSFPLVDPSTMLPPVCNAFQGSDLELINDVMWTKYSNFSNEKLSFKHIRLPQENTLTDLSGLIDENHSDSETIIPGALTDHSYFCTRKIKVLDTPAPSPAESEDEEIDVVTVEKIPTSIKFQSRQSICVISSSKGIVSPVTCSMPSTPTTPIVQRIVSKRPLLSPVVTDSCRKLKTRYIDSYSENSISNFKPCNYVKNKHKANKGIVYTESDEKRSQHNDLERRRRNDMKSSFQFLRENIPALNNLQKAPKVTILNAAKNYIAELERQQLELNKRFKENCSRKEQLQKTLSRLLEKHKK